MSSARGSSNRKRPQKHQNRTAFKNDLHDTSHQTKFINSLAISGVCKRCKDILEWKIKYKKYKPLAAPRKCTVCQQKAIKHAYHMLCSQCAKDKKVCPKCCKSAVDEELINVSQNEVQNTGSDLKLMLKALPERKRRTVLRHINKQDGDQDFTPEIIAEVEDMLSKIDNINLDDESLFDGEYSDSDVESENYLADDANKGVS